MKRAFGLTSLLLLTLAVGLLGGVILERQTLAPVAVPAGAASDFRLMGDAWNTIKKVYVDQPATDPARLTYGAIGGMVDSLGDTGHSRFLTPDQLKEEEKFVQGQFEGIGVEVQLKEGQVVIVAPIDGSPAQEAGIRSGEVILKVEGQPVTGLPLTEVVKRITGPAGTPVTVTILDPATGQTKDYTLVRRRITIQTVTWQQLPGTTVAHVHMGSFSQGATEQLKNALNAIKSQGLTGVILDLRDNPGGLLDESVATASQFLKEGDVLQEKDVKGQVTAVHAQQGGVATDVPMVMLVNAGTASAAEIVAGAIQDAARAKLVGDVTFGTGTVLGQYNLSDGSAMLLAIQEWLTPKGRTIWHTGITPDVKVPLPAAVAPLFPADEKGMTPAQLQQSNDTQLLQALKLLTQQASQ